jgi:pimeloyl-ACP methyl ester carboxylesterase
VGHVLVRAGVAAGEPGPYVLVGDGRGAYTLRVYAARWPEAVAGVVPVDPVPDEQLDRLDVQPLWLAQTVWVVGALGVPRLKGGWTRHPPFPSQAWPVVTALGLRTAALRASFAELVALETSAAQVRAARGAFPPVPLVAVTPAPPPRRGSARKRYRVSQELHAPAARLSPRGVQVVADTATSPLPLTAPATIAGAVREVIAAVH